ncbi:MAG: hypothetical protein CML19_07270 [Pusillimonas sp.]|nr:hypothetical protein [Pusillimonas sp.]
MVFECGSQKHQRYTDNALRVLREAITAERSNRPGVNDRQVAADSMRIGRDRALQKQSTCSGEPTHPA